MWAQGRSGQVRKISPLPGFDPRTVQPIASRYTDYATRPTNQVQDVSLSFLCARQLLGDNPADAEFLFHKRAVLGEAVKIHFTVPFPYQSL